MAEPREQGDDRRPTRPSLSLDAWNDAPDLTGGEEYVYDSPVDDGVLPATDQLPTPALPPVVPPPIVESVAKMPSSVWVPTLVLMAVLLFVSAGYDILTILTPGSASTSRWRFAIVGSATPKLLKVTVAGALITLALALSESRILSNIFAFVLMLGSLVVLAVAPLFLLDALQVRPALPARMSGSVFTANVSFALALLVVMSLVLFACALALRKTSNWLKLDLNSPTNIATREWDR